jgi:uncharacterized protein YjbJ (UPF0337 family)
MTDGKTDEAKGRLKQAGGDLTGDDDLSREGKVDEKTGQAKDKVSDAADSVSEKAKDITGKDDD